MATEIKETGLGQIDRLTLLDPGIKVSNYKVDGKNQQGLIHKVDSGMMYKTAMCLHFDMIISLCYHLCYLYSHIINRMMLLSLTFSTLRVNLVFGMKLLVMLTSGPMEEKINRREFIQTDTKLRYIFSQEPLLNHRDANT